MKHGQRIRFYPGGNKPGRKGTFQHKVPNHPGIVNVRLDTDPYDVCVSSEYVHKLKRKTNNEETSTMATATATKPKAKDLRRSAKALGVKGWEDMELDELIEAVEKAEVKQSKKSSGKSSGKKGKKAAQVVDDDDDDDDDDVDDDDDDDDDEEDEAPAKSKKSSKKAAKSAPAKKSGKKADKASSKKSSKKAKDEDDDEDAAENGNPYTPGSNLWHMTEELIKGGKRSAMVKRLSKKISLKPRTRTFTEEEEIEELDRRLVIVSQNLRNDHGFSMEREGRGKDTVLRLYKD